MQALDLSSLLTTILQHYAEPSWRWWAESWVSAIDHTPCSAHAAFTAAHTDYMTISRASGSSYTPGAQIAHAALNCAQSAQCFLAAQRGDVSYARMAESYAEAARRDLAAGLQEKKS